MEEIRKRLFNVWLGIILICGTFFMLFIGYINNRFTFVPDIDGTTKIILHESWIGLRQIVEFVFLISSGLWFSYKGLRK